MTVKIISKGDRLTLRISKKDKFALELLALKKKSSLSALVMESLEPKLREGLTIPKPKGRKGEKVYIPDEAFDPLAPDRLVKLAMIQPELLSELEQIIWKVVNEEPTYWSDGQPNFEKIRDSWSGINDTANKLLESFSS